MENELKAFFITLWKGKITPNLPFEHFYFSPFFYMGLGLSNLTLFFYPKASWSRCG
jgi:hypothetical protein